MSNPKECQGRAYHTPSAANPLYCYRCHSIIYRVVMNGVGPKYHAVGDVTKPYESAPLNELPTGDMGE